MNGETGNGIILAGIGITLIGIILYLLHDKLHSLGNLPGDIKIGKENFNFISL